MATGRNKLTARTWLAKLSATGAANASRNPGADGPVNALAGSGDGSVVAGGEFGNAGGQQRLSLARLNATGALLSGPDIEVPGRVDDMGINLDGDKLGQPRFAGR
jgi:hypothetical protein